MQSGAKWPIVRADLPQMLTLPNKRESELIVACPLPERQEDGHSEVLGGGFKCQPTVRLDRAGVNTP